MEIARDTRAFPHPLLHPHIEFPGDLMQPVPV
jgi:hypothetical protein